MSQINTRTVLLGKEWNRVEDSLPSEGFPVVFLISNLDIPIAGVFFEGGFYQCSVRESKNLRWNLELVEKSKVIAWMEVPMRIKTDSKAQPGGIDHA